MILKALNFLSRPFEPRFHVLLFLFHRSCSVLIPFDMMVTSFSFVSKAISLNMLSTLGSSCRFSLLGLAWIDVSRFTPLYTPNGVEIIGDALQILGKTTADLSKGEGSSMTGL